MSGRAPARLWIKVILPDGGQLGPGKVDLLNRVQEHRSLAAAARSMKMSYRRAWLLVDELNTLFGQPLVAKWHGGKARGGAALTPFGESVVRRYAEIIEKAGEASGVALAELGAARSPRVTSRPSRRRRATARAS